MTLALLAALLWHAGRAPSWAWLSEVLAGDFIQDPADPDLVIWTGLWPEQRLESTASSLEALFSQFLWGKRMVRGSLAGEGFSAGLEIRRPFGALAENELPFLHVRAWASGLARRPFPLLRQVSASGAWELRATASRLDEQVAHWELDWTLRDVQVEFGPADGAEPAGTLALSRVEGRAERDGLSLDIMDFRGEGEGVGVTGKGTILANAADPLRSTLSLSFKVSREPGSAALWAKGWEEAIAGTYEMVLGIRGTVADPVFYLNGFPLIKETLRAARPVHASTLDGRIAQTAAANLGIERSPTGNPPGEETLEGSSEGPQPYAGYSESDIRKMQALLNDRVAPERARQVEGHTPKYRKRWKELKQAYKDELKKLQREGVDLRKEFGRKPGRQMRKLIREQLDGEFPDEAAVEKEKGEEAP